MRSNGTNAPVRSQSRSLTPLLRGPLRTTERLLRWARSGAEVLAELVGSTCRVQRLVARSDLNGKQCTVESFDEARGRCQATVGSERVWVKPENLVEVLPDALARAANGGDYGTVEPWRLAGGDEQLSDLVAVLSSCELFMASIDVVRSIDVIYS